MPSSRVNVRPNALWVGIVMGVLLAVITVLASGFMIETTNTDTFCVSCHVMEPFRDAWAVSVHDGDNPQGFAAQCVDCHLPHGNFVEYLTTTDHCAFWRPRAPLRARGPWCSAGVPSSHLRTPAR